MSGPAPDLYPGLDLLPQHAKLLADSAISPEVAKARGYRSIRVRADLKRLGFGDSQRNVPALVIPIWHVHGEIAMYQARPDQPRAIDGRVVKYETPKGSGLVIDVPPPARAALGGPDGPLFITEGARKSDAAVSVGLCCIDLLGVHGFRGRNALGGLVALPDWEFVAFKGTGGRRREVFLAFDSDIMHKRPVFEALKRLKGVAESKGGRPFIIYLPSGPGGVKVGLDDFLAAGHTVDDLLALAQEELREPPADTKPRVYFTTTEGIFWNKTVGEGVVPIQLANFRAAVTADIIEDDGVETERFFEVEAKLGESTAKLRIPAARFGWMGWPVEHLGHKAVIMPGQLIKEHLRVAIQTGREDTTTERIYRCTGWLPHEGSKVFLHAGGAIGAQGQIDGVAVRLPDALAHYRLPAPPEGADLVAAAEAEFRFIGLGPARVLFPLVGATFRAALGACDSSLFISGRSGVFKSAITAVAQQHYGADMDRLHLPTNFHATENVLEDLSFTAKDAVLVIDDFAPTGTAQQISALHAKADRIFRAAGNRSARQRMRADTTLRAPRPPRGLLMGTGEDVPRGQSLRARTLILELADGDIDPTRLRQSQTDAAAGLVAGLMAAFLKWLAPRIDEIQGHLPAEIVRLRECALRDRQHRRTPEIVANLAVGWECLLAFLHEKGLLSRDEVSAWWRRAWSALGEAADAQRKHQAAAEPTGRFIHLIQAAVPGGLAHLAGPEGHPPPAYERLGWKPGRGDEPPRGQGLCIGWIDGPDVYLEPENAYIVAQRMGRDQNEPLTTSLEMLCRLLHERKILKTVEESGNEVRYRIRKVLGGSRKRVLHLPTGLLFPPEIPGHPGHDPENAAEQAFGWPGAWPGQGEVPGHGPGHDAPPPLWPLLGFGPDGPDGPEKGGENPPPAPATGETEIDL